MAVARWNPWGDLFSLHNQMDQLFNQVLAPEQETRGRDMVTNLPVDIRQTEQAFVIEASVPGLHPDDVEVTFEDGILTIRGTPREQEAQDAGTYIRRERRPSSVFRQVGLPSDVQAESISADFENGVLTITVPREPKAQPRRIQVTAGQGAGKKKVIDAPASGRS